MWRGEESGDEESVVRRWVIAIWVVRGGVVWISAVRRVDMRRV